MNLINKTDHKFMAYAINLSKKNIGKTSSNPTVGCVIAKDDKILSSAVTEISGRPHAEKIAIEKVANKSDLQGAIIYVTLEPCFHYGQTSPCVDEIIKYGIKKVVIATRDIDERVNEKSIQKLRDCKIEVEIGICENEAKEINKYFFKSKKEKTPYVTVKLATSLDGKIACKNFDSKWITNEKSRKFSHILRSINQAILVGANTVKKDNPKLNCRIPGLENFSPVKIIISKNLDFLKNSEIFKEAEIIIICSINSDEKKVTEFQKLENVKIIKSLEDENGDINLKEALKEIYKCNINSVLIEGGSEVVTKALKENLIDELIWIRSPKIIGNDGIGAIKNLNFSEVSQSLNNFIRSDLREFDGDIAEFFRKA